VLEAAEAVEARKQGSREAGKQGSREAGKQGSREAGSREAGKQGSREAGKQEAGSREAGKKGSRGPFLQSAKCAASLELADCRNSYIERTASEFDNNCCEATGQSDADRNECH
jgi:hypothetical protein